MKIDIWSDIMCPFCYIGKRRLEAALEGFEHKDKVELVWHSFQLDPTIQSQQGKNLYQYLAERKGMPLERSKQMHDQLTQTAKEAGLTYNFDKAVIANSFDAHRLIQLAKKHGLGDAAEERLFKAYFTEGKDMSDHATLLQLGTEIGLDDAEIKQMLESNAYADAVHSDIATAEQLRINGVPFFVLDNKYGVSGAQPVELFSNALQQAWAEHTPAITSIGGEQDAVCGPDGCEI